MKISAFGERFGDQLGVLQLMDDFAALADSTEPTVMLGGGNPACLPEVMAAYQQQMQALCGDANQFNAAFGNYDTPVGRMELVDALVKLLNREYGWGIGREHVALTNGSQNAFFCLFNLFGGRRSDGTLQKVLLPMAPEYMGYTDVAVGERFFASHRPTIEELPGGLFKYHVDFNAVKVGDDIGALCVSRPTNPTGNVLTDDEINHLDQLARDNDVPLIVDNAYGAPFPDITAGNISPSWNDNTIMCMSLSKIGLPAVRTGIVIARPDIVREIGAMNAVMNLSPGGIGPSLLAPLVKSGEIITLSRQHIRPFYKARAEFARDRITRALTNTPARLHRPEGAIFVWLWMPELPISTFELYQRLKAKHVVVVPGEHFFPGLEGDDWEHKHQCLRISVAQPEAILSKGLDIIIDEVKSLYAGVMA
ncbi:MAG: valine--pyruvate transaminase [Granulosicoccaceae bacterium]